MTEPTTDQIREAITKAAGGMFFPTESWPPRARIEALALQEDVLSGKLRMDGPVRVIVESARLLAEADHAEMVPLVIAVVFGDELQVAGDELRLDGPTLEEYVAAGYKPETYPPQGYGEKPSPGLEAWRASVRVEGEGQTPAESDPSS